MIRSTIRRYLRRIGDELFESRNGSRIVLGTDRKDIPDSGWGEGGRNDPNSATIDLAAGVVGENPSYREDKSRLLLSAKTNPDEYFSIEKGNRIEGEPAAVLVSDNLYLIGRKIGKIIIGNCSILLNEDGTLEIESATNLKLKCGGSVVEINSSGEIFLGSNAGLGARIITENDICVGIDPGTSAPILSNFRNPAAVVTNQKVKIK